ncbi:MAG: membrane protein insertase YidC [Pseudoxanthomonas sp.]|jgi:YidC/Oxa1 family membrane protein insertase|uniref:membrane protein insertase YidC n=1 Tax=Pseudoxanthomonas TaxID=83618 RepID=UPI00138978C6|nr:MULTISPECIES: membrane protein insertase YidC [Pseudoxanthomonas]KAF1720197.1 membrane protein insertase YidC [Pseudoxanthomonas mexicana]MCH2092506.1 membrane protein insertase YidC [Pseudoxanthomonas sp.]MCP1582456.1 YidC/Oxa1 family membrane protein insertase [Pseudoxanthomonas mexicana]
MNQTRVFLIFAWLMVATLLWFEWSRDKAAPAQPTVAAQTATAPAGSTVPTATDAAPATGTVPAAPVATPGITQAPRAAAAPRVTVNTDVLRLVLDGGSVLQADLLHYPQSKTPGSGPVRLFSEDPQHFYTAESGWVSNGSKAPDHHAFVPENGAGEVALAKGSDSISVPFVWQGPEGVTIRRTYTFKRASYEIEVRDQVVNAGAGTWQGTVYRQLLRTPPQVKSGMTNPESFSFNGATWWDGSYQRRKFNEDYLEDGRVNAQVKGGWIAIPQHHFFSAWIPSADDTTTISLDTPDNGARALIREMGPGVNVGPGQQATTTARLWVGPKLVDKIHAINAPGIDRVVDYSQFAILALLGQGLFWVLNFLHGFIGNWGWSIIGLVILVKLALYPLSAAQYKSFAKMRKFQPRIQQLKERYGDDKQKFQVAMMELYKKEKINPMGGCLPILVQMPVFLALYWVLVETVELRQAPWFAWIQDLTARDPYFILPVLNMLVMWLTQKLTPAPGMDPMQQKMMQFMPLVFGVMMAFFPSGLVLYWVTNGALGLLQQWWMTKRHGESATPPKTAIAK